MKAFLIIIFFICPFAFSLQPVPPSYSHIAKTSQGIQLQLEDAPSPEGGSYTVYEILDKKKKVIKRFPVSDTQFEVHAVDEKVHGEKISEQSCRNTLQELESELKKLKFKKLKIDPEECAKNRKNFYFVKKLP